MILTTTNSIDDYKILTYKGIVSGCAIKMPKITMTFSMEKYYTGFSERVSELKENALLILREKAELEVIGDGPLRREYDDLINSLKLQNVVRLRGNMPHNLVFNELDSSHVFVLISEENF